MAHRDQGRRSESGLMCQQAGGTALTGPVCLKDSRSSDKVAALHGEPDDAVMVDDDGVRIAGARIGQPVLGGMLKPNEACLKATILSAQFLLPMDTLRHFTFPNIRVTQ